MIKSIIAAIGKQNQIGLDNKLLWNLKDDLANFKKLTLNHAIIMGRKTFESIGHPLANRINVVLSKNTNYKPEGVAVFNNLEDAYHFLKDEDEIFICGGEKIYKEALKNQIDKMYITFVDYNGAADTFFPEIDYSLWQQTASQKFTKNEFNQYNFVIKTFCH